MRRIIINIDDDVNHLEDSNIIQRVLSVVNQGRISKTANREHYCHVTTWTDRTGVFATRNAKGTDIFRVFYDEPQQY